MPTRRDFLKGACSIAALSLGAALIADDAVAADGVVRLADGRVRLTLAKVPALAKVDGVVNLGTVKGIPVAVVRTGRTTYAAISLVCTHQGTTVQRQGTQWVCPNHGSRFLLNGSFVSGPAGRALNTVPSTLRSGKLTVG